MAKAKWGTKQTCPKCGTRFYDLGKENPVVCIECGNEWVPEPILKSRQPQLVEVKKPEEPETKVKEGDENAVVEDETSEGDDNSGKPGVDVDLGDDDSDVSETIAKPKPDADAG